MGDSPVENWYDFEDDPARGWELRLDSDSSVPDEPRLNDPGLSGRAWDPEVWGLGKAEEPSPGEGADFSLRLEGGADQDEPLRSKAGARTRSGRGPSLRRIGPPFPTLGEVVAGFRILGELGRGSFARVYLAEQVGLGHRRVALKVAVDIGEEPQRLARLQHTHIMPIHSVHEDPLSGLRLLCMPYLGGANLAQVLATAGGRLPSQVTGQSLIEALDQIGGRVSFGASERRGSSHDSTTVLGWNRPSQQRATGVGLAPASVMRSALSRCWSRVSRWSRTDSQPRATEDEEELAQPARRFLRRATTIQAAVWIAARLAEGLEHAHCRGLLHRDLKPSNVLLAADGTPMILDFNLSAEREMEMTDEAARAKLGGTMPYMAPEHLDAFNPRGQTSAKAVDERSDLYALGLILFEMVAGTHPFEDPPEGMPMPETLELMTEQRRQGAPSVRAFNPQVPWSLDSILRKCLEPDPERRYATASDMAEDLRRFLDDRPLKSAVEPSLQEQLAKWARRNPRATSSSTVALVALILLLGLGSLAGLLRSNYESAAARLERGAFATQFAQCQLLLNTAGAQRTTHHLETGLAEAQRALRRYGIDGPGMDWTESPLVRSLPSRDRSTLFEEVAELLQLEARARVTLSRDASERERAEALRWAIARLDQAERIDPRPSSALYQDRASFAAALGWAEQAAEDRARAERLPPTSARDFYMIGTSMLAQGQPDAAEGPLSRAVALDPRRFWAWFALGLCHADQQRPRDAAHDFSVCTILEPEFAWAYVNRGLALAQQGRFEEAKASYDRAVELEPDLVEARINRSLVLLERGDAPQAAEDLALAIEQGWDDPAILAAWAEAMTRAGQGARAEQVFDDALRKHPNATPVVLARGFARLNSEPDAARADFERALRLDPQNARAYLGLAHLQRKSEPSKALEHLDRALKLEPGFGDALQLRAVLRGRLGMPSAQDDVHALIQVPTPHRLYNAACALSLLGQATENPRLFSESLSLLERALHAGFPPEVARNDPDLAPLQKLDAVPDPVQDQSPTDSPG